MDKPLVWLYGEIKTPPFSKEARIEAGFLLRRLQKGENIGMPHSRPMPSIGPRCHELRIKEATGEWRVIYRANTDAIIIADVFKKKTKRTSKDAIARSKDRLRRYDDA